MKVKPARCARRMSLKNRQNRSNAPRLFKPRPLVFLIGFISPLILGVESRR